MTDIDNLLDDLDALIAEKPPPTETSNSSDGSFRYKVPHPPNDKSPSQIYNHTNPKNKFVSSSASSSHTDHAPVYRSENIQNHNYSTGKGAESIDALLDLFPDSPIGRPPPTSTTKLKNTSFESSDTNQHYNSSRNSSSQYREQRNNQGYSSSALPTFDTRNDFGASSDMMHNSSYNNTVNSSRDVNSFDSLLSDINSTLPPVSPDTKKNDAGAYSSSSASLLQPPTQDINTGVKGSRCSRVVIAGSSIPRGSKTSAFSKSACDRLRCLKCNFEALQFSGFAWSSDADYMFFRNNMPNSQKLASKLLDKPLSVAYCCQCSWISTEEELTLSPGQVDKPQWVCAGH